MVPTLLLAVVLTVTQSPQPFTTPGESGAPPITYFGDDAEEGLIELTAWNGFFESGSFVARGARPAPEDERPFIAKHFDSLETRKEPGSARWHVWLPEAGTLEVSAFLAVAEEQVGAAWRVDCGGDRSLAMATASDGASAQPWTCRFALGAGKHTIQLTAEDPQAAAGTKVLRLELKGDAVPGAKLLRARWRPAAVHTSYTSTTCESSTLWVFETKSLNGASSYSPINTPFGYFGTTFDASRTKPRGFNFSMWAVPKWSAVPALSTMPHLIATGSAAADFSGFGHEGSGVKLRGWDCLDWNPTSVIQALRIERRGERDFYHGYFYHEPQQRWVLYASGARHPRKKGKAAAFRAVTAFCETPGPPARQRSGDVLRKVARRGWFFGPDGGWHVADVHSCKDRQSASARRIGTAEDGWHVSIAGGMEIVDDARTRTLPAPRSSKLPAYLRPGKVEGLFALPVEFRSHSVLDVSSASATVQYELQGLGANAAATLYYGPVDCLTFVARELHSTEKKGASAAFYTKGRTWPEHTDAEPARSGVQRFHLKDLEPSTTYFYRAFVTHEDGKSWSFETGSFKTLR